MDAELQTRVSELQLMTPYPELLSMILENYKGDCTGLLSDWEKLSGFIALCRDEEISAGRPIGSDEMRQVFLALLASQEP